jgi:hypothetical protein
LLEGSGIKIVAAVVAIEVAETDLGAALNASMVIVFVFPRCFLATASSAMS